MRIKGIDKLQALLLVVSIICCRPMLLGNLYAPVSLIIMVCLIAIRLWKKDLKIKRDTTKYKIYISCIVFFFYCFVQGILLSDRTDTVIKEVIYYFFFSTCFFLCTERKQVIQYCIKILYVLMTVCVVSYLITLIQALRFGWTSQYIKEFDYGYFTNSKLYFPFTLTYSHTWFNGINLQRMLGFARESGIMQIFYVWGFFMADKYFARPIIMKIIMGLGVIACFSTAGFIVFGLSLMISNILNNKKFFSFNTVLVTVLAGIMIYVLFFARGTNIGAKANESILGRTDAISFGLNGFIDRPLFGHGFYDTLGNSLIQTGICAISSLGQIGIIGFLLWLNIWVCAFFFASSARTFLCANAAFFITALFSQPLMFAPVMYMFFFIGYDDKKELLFLNGRGINER